MQGDPREQVFAWLRSPDNPWFARSFVNRIWAHYYGVGLVDPVDDFSLANPPTNARLLELLGKDFVDCKFNIRDIEKRILMSRTYQTSAKPNETNKFDKNNFARSYIRPMIQLRSVMDGGTAMRVRAHDYDDPQRWWI